MRDLRARCPWDAAQTAATLRPYLIEEVFELDHAIGLGDDAAIRIELGDLLLHLAFQIVLGEERDAFGAGDITQAVEAKMWRRHPHLFPDRVVGGAAGGTPGAPRTWEHQKRTERSADASVLDGLPPTMPALVMAHRLQERAAGVGFDWPDVQGPLDKVREEAGEVVAALDTGDATAIEQELGDLLFAAVNVARKAGFDPRAALEKANGRFADRFRRIEALARARGIDLYDAGLAVLDGMWEEVKQEG